MRGFQTARLMLLGIAVAVASTSTSDSDAPAILNFRPDNVTLADYYLWVGSYYNGTTHFEFSPYAGLAASTSSSACPAIRNKTITKDYTTVLGLTEPATYNTVNDPVNAFLNLWPLGFDLGTISNLWWVEQLFYRDYGLYSSYPVTTNYSIDKGYNNFNWTLEKTQAPPYNLSSVLTRYAGESYLYVNSTTTANCSGTEVSSWKIAIMSYNTTYNGTNFTNPVVDLQFDGTTANMSMRGDFSAVALYWIQGVWEEYNVMLAGEFSMTFSGLIDLYHSDVLRNDTATPTWLRTVGYQNNSLNVGYISASARNQLFGSCLLAGMLALAQVVLFFF